MQWVKRGAVIALLWSGGVWADPAQELVSLLNSEQQAEQLQAQMQAQMIPLIIRAPVNMHRSWPSTAMYWRPGLPVISPGRP